jgi:hypothetical protein
LYSIDYLEYILLWVVWVLRLLLELVLRLLLELVLRLLLELARVLECLLHR